MLKTFEAFDKYKNRPQVNPPGLITSYDNWKIKWNHNIALDHSIFDRIRERTGLSLSELNEKIKKTVQRIEALLYRNEINKPGDYAFILTLSEFTFIINIDPYKPSDLYIRTILDKDMKIKMRDTLKSFSLFEKKIIEIIL